MILLRKIIVPLLREVKVSDKRRASYYVMEPEKPVNLPIRYQDTTKYGFLPVKRGKNVVQMLCLLQTQEKVIKNPIAVGTPKYIKINFQKIWNNQVTDHTRNLIAIKLKESYEEALSKVPHITEGFPLKTNFTIHSKNELQDVDNLTFLYIKTFHDAIAEAGIIPDDKLKYLKRYEAGHEESEEEYIEIDILSMYGNTKTEGSKEQELAEIPDNGSCNTGNGSSPIGGGEEFNQAVQEDKSEAA